MSALIPAWIDGELTPIDKLEVHRRGLRHLAISVFIMDGRRTLLQRRALSKYHTPGLWANACCTHPHWGEQPEATAVRRLREELGITNIKVAARDTLEYRADVGNDLTEHEVVSLFTAEGKPALYPNPDEVMDTGWITLDDLRRQIQATPGRFTPWLRIYMTKHAEQIFGTIA